MTAIKSAFDERVAIALDGGIAPSQAIDMFTSKTGISSDDIEIVHADDQNPGEKLEKKSSVLGEQMLYRHLSYAFMGLMVGMLIALLLISFGPELFARNPLFTFVAFISPGIVIGAFLAGARALKPEHDATNLKVMRRRRNEKATLIIKTDDKEMKERVQKLVNSTIGLTFVQ